MKIRGANAPRNSITKPQKSGNYRVFTAFLWPSGHSRVVGVPGFERLFYLQLDLQFKSEILTKWPLIFGFNRLICRDLF